VKVLVKEKIGESGVELLRDAGLEVELGMNWDGAELERRIGEFEGILIRSGTRLTAELLARAGSRDGLVVPLGSREQNDDADSADGATMQVDGIEVAASMSQGETLTPRPEPEAGGHLLAPGAPSVGDPAAESPSSSTSAPGPADIPPLLVFGGADPAPRPRPLDAYSLRLVTQRKLYDGGVIVQRSPSMAPLAPGTRLRANPHDLSRLGIRPGDLVRVTSARASLVLEAASDPGVPRGSASVDFNQPDEGAGDLIDATQGVTEVRVETATRSRGT
jgi:anaerobic selenocysteine-containing dehydrogenase